MNTYSLPPIFGVHDVAAPASSWAMAAWDVDQLRSVNDGQSVLTAVLDTGGDINHPELKGRIVASKDFTGSRVGFADSHGHGTHCLGTVGGLSRSIGVSMAPLLNGKVLGDSGSGGDAGIAAGVRWAVGQGAEIISMSLGSSSPSPTIREACAEAAAKGVWVIAAAGNEGNAGIGYPGGYPECLSVAAIDRNFRIANFSSRGDKLDASGPGVDIVSAKPGGGYQSMSGTSMATPFIAGLLACFRGALKAKNRPIFDVGQLRAFLGTTAVDLGAKGDDRDFGPGWAAPLLLLVSTFTDPKPIGV